MAQNRKRIVNKMKEYLRDIAVTGMAFLLFVTFVIQTYAVEGSSMEPTLISGDRLLAEKVSYRFGSITPGDVVVLFYPPEPSKTFVKRIIAGPGDLLEIRKGTPYINGKPVTEEFLIPSVRSFDSVPSVKIPPGYYFAMGDHRNVSYDSRHFGFIPQRYIIGRAIIRYWPPNKIGLID